MRHSLDLFDDLAQKFPDNTTVAGTRKIIKTMLDKMP